jgi:hypothetical protein
MKTKELASRRTIETEESRIVSGFRATESVALPAGLLDIIPAPVQESKT